MDVQGSQLYFIDPEDSNAVIEVGCVKNLTGIGAPRAQRDTTCISSRARTYKPGMPTPGTVSFTVDFEPGDASHARLYEIWSGATGQPLNLPFALGWSDGDQDSEGNMSPPDVDSEGDVDPTTDRTWLVFTAYVIDVPLDFAVDTEVAGNLSLQMVGMPTLYPKAP